MKELRPMKKLFSFIILLMFASFSLPGQVDPLIYNGARKNRANNVHDGNQIRTHFFNYGLIGRKIDEEFGGEWPKNSGQEAVGDVSMNVGAEVKALADTAAIISVHGLTGDEPYYQTFLDSAIAANEFQIMVTVSDGPRTQNEYSPDGETFWGWEPIQGFNSPDSSLVAMSHLPETWPPFWPDRTELSDGWAGAWNGYFGRGVTNADQESYWRMDDYSDQEFKKPLSDYYPLPDSDPSRGGLGLQAGARGFQWTNAQAKDAIFWVYDIANISDKDLDKTGFSILMGGIIGLSSSNDNAEFYSSEVDRNGEKLNMAVSYDDVLDGWDELVWVGYKYLESPGNFSDGIDNDKDSPLTDAYGQDNIIDSTNTEMFGPVQLPNGADVVLIGEVTNEVMDLGNGAEDVYYVQYNSDYERTVVSLDRPVVINSGDLNDEYIVRPGDVVKEEKNDLLDNNLNGLIDENPIVHHGFAHKNYLTGVGTTDPMIDERRDDGIDNNGNWNPSTDDVGADGVPGTGDFGENDGVPTAGEPNFDALDIIESDQIGLTAFDFFFPFTDLLQNKDIDMWERMAPADTFDVTVQDKDGDFIFSASYFPLNAGQTERISLVLLYANDETGLINKAATVQQIYNFNYNFAQAPTVPQVNGVAQNQKAVLYWDASAEDSYDRLFGRADPDQSELGFDFEGYRIYRSTSPEFELDITNAYGEGQLIKPIAIFDLDNEISGLSYNDIEGVRFNLGDNSGLAHSYEDDNKINGLTYYYVVNAFDRGYDTTLYAGIEALDQFRDIAPSESPFSIKLLPSGEVVTGPNVVAITPANPALGYVEPKGADGLDHVAGVGTGLVDLRLLDPYAFEADSAKYRVTFTDSVDIVMTYSIKPDGQDLQITGYDTFYTTVGVNVEKLLPNASGLFTGSIDTVYKDWPVSSSPLVIDGMELTIENEESRNIDNDLTGLRDANGNLIANDSAYVQVTGILKSKLFLGALEAVVYPYDYAIEIYDEIVDTSIAVNKYTLFPLEKLDYDAIPVRFKVLNVTRGEYVDFLFREQFEPFVNPDTQLPDTIFYADSSFSYNDRLVILEGPRDGYVSIDNGITQSKIDLGWVVLTEKDTLKQAFEPGQSYFIKAKKLFNRDDIYESVITKAKFDANIAKNIGLDNVRVVPNPYYGTSMFEQYNPLITGPGERQIQFRGLPPKCTIRIYTVYGDLIDTIYHNGDLSSDAQSWDLKTRDNLDLAYGVYIFHVDAPGIGEKIGKFAVIK
jgi:hypothetical protein